MTTIGTGFMTFNLSVCLFSWPRTAKAIEMSFEVVSEVGPVNYRLDGDQSIQIPPPDSKGQF